MITISRNYAYVAYNPYVDILNICRKPYDVPFAKDSDGYGKAHQ